MSAPVQTLTSDVQRALQHAVVEANNAFALSSIVEHSRKKQKKRAREDAHLEDQTSQERKLKKKQCVADKDRPTDGALAGVPLSEGETPSTKKRRKAKRKLPVTRDARLANVQPGSQSPHADDSGPSSSPDTTTQPSTTDFLSAIVAAASATSDTHLQTPSPSQILQPHCLPNPPIQYPYHLPQFAHLPHSQPPNATMPTSFSLPELSSGSNEDILRAIQDLDISKIANVLKTLNDAAAAANVSLGPQASFMPPPPIALGQFPVGSNTILAQPGSQTTTLPEFAGPHQDINQDHAQLLSTKWLNASKLAELVKTEGLVYKKGKFSAIEERQLKDAIENYRVHKQLTHEQLNDVIFMKNEKSKDNAFWSEITAAIPLRPIIAVYHHVRRGFHPLKQQGKWMSSEDGLLKRAVDDLGQQWEKVSAVVGRMSSDCRDRYRNHIANRELRVSGIWTKEEEDELTRIVTDMTVKQGRDIDDDVFWGKVSERMGNRRGRQQCRIKWTDSLSKTVKNEGRKPRWSQQDAYILVHKIASLSVRDDSEIDWKTLPDPCWNLWSAHSLQRRWLGMKKSVKGYEDMTHQEIMDILREKKAQTPVMPPISRKRKVSTPAIVADAEDADSQPEAGSSFGPGTLSQSQ